MKNSLLIFAVMMVSISMGFAESWKIKSDLGLSLNQSAYSDNWAGSEVGSLSWTANSITSMEKQLSEIINSKTSLKLSFGQTHQQTIDANGDKFWAKPLKSSDKIDLESLLKFNFGFYLDPFASFRWESQFLDQSDPSGTISFNPNLFTEAAGISRTFIKNESDDLNARLGAAFRQLINRDVYNEDTAAYDTKTITDGGIEFIGSYEKLLRVQDVKLNSKLVLYQALINSEDENDDWKALDIKWENSISTKIWKAISMNLYFEIKYEKEEDNDIQFKQTMGLGVSYRLY